MHEMCLIAAMLKLNLPMQTDQIAVDIASSAMTAPSGRQGVSVSSLGAAAKAAADALVAEALSAGALDNVTAVVCALQWD